MMLNNDVLLSMLSAMCAGFDMGLVLIVFFVPGWWIVVVLCLSCLLLLAALGILSRADRVRTARWSRKEWR